MTLEMPIMVIPKAMYVYLGVDDCSDDPGRKYDGREEVICYAAVLNNLQHFGKF